jgi:hypothetical protein
MRIAVLLLLCCSGAGGQLAGTELTMRTFNSVDVQVCVDGILSSEHAAVQAAVNTQLQALLLSTAVYFVRTYTIAARGTVCYVFVHQARSPEGAREAVQTLMTDTSTLAVPYQGGFLACAIDAVPWVGEDIGPIGLDWQFGANDVMLWGGCAGSVLAMCSVAVCCFVQLSVSKESRRAELLLAKDRKAVAAGKRNDKRGAGEV